MTLQAKAYGTTTQLTLLICYLATYFYFITKILQHNYFMITSARLTVILFFVLLFSNSYAQDKGKKDTIDMLTDSTQKAQNEEKAKAPKEEAELRTIFGEFINAYATLETHKDKFSVLKHMAKEVQSTIIFFYVGGRANTIVGDYAGFSTFMDKLINTQGLSIKYEVVKVPRIYVSGGRGVVVYVVEYDVQKNGSSWSKGNETVTLTYKKIGGEWKILQYSIVNIEDEKLRGACICELYGDGTGDYVAKTTIPNGRTYDTDLNTFEFTKIGEDRIIKTAKGAYRWDKDGTVFLRESALPGVNAKETFLGKAATFDKKDVLTMILKKHIYVETCTEIKINEKK
jgi:hypothetical protein